MNLGVALVAIVVSLSGFAQILSAIGDYVKERRASQKGDRDEQ